MTDLIESPLAARHAALGAKFGEFGGWSMPLEYAGVIAEHHGVRTAVGLFDVSHLGTFMVEGPGAAAYLNTRLSNDLGRIGPGQAQYTLLLNAAGGVIDDMIAYVIGDDQVMVLPNAANSDVVLATLREGSPDLAWTDRHRSAAILAVQGPNSAAVLASVGLPADLAYMSFMAAEIEGTPGTVCRTGYTGEHGYEIIVDAAVAGVVWDRLIASGEAFGIQPCGLGARDTLRTEMGYPLHGHDITPDISPVEARLTWAVGWKKPRFDGDAAVREARSEGVARTLLGLRALGRAIPRPGMTVRDATGGVGVVTSGTFSPTLKLGIGLALLPAGVVPGDTVDVEVRGRTDPFAVVKPPFVPSHVDG